MQLNDSVFCGTPDKRIQNRLQTGKQHFLKFLNNPVENKRSARRNLREENVGYTRASRRKNVRPRRREAWQAPLPPGQALPAEGAAGRARRRHFLTGGSRALGGSSAALKAAAAETLSEITLWGIKPTPPRSGGRLPSLSRLFIDLALFFYLTNLGRSCRLKSCPKLLSFTPLHTFSLHPPSK